TLAQSDACFFDGTFWSSDELGRVAPVQGEDAPSPKRAEDMAHWPVGGPRGSLAFLSGLRGPRRIYIHVNNTNPMLRRSGPEAQQLTAAGVELAHDGLELTL
ncbi:MAG TPA: hypothetical protein VJR89_19770, partial [Polyangiales bacterium]|nr:hypothetical protein [Polyangiales bacterium]